LHKLRNDESLFEGLPSSFYSWLPDVKSEIARLGHPAEVLDQLQQIENDYLRVTARFSTLAPSLKFKLADMPSIVQRNSPEGSKVSEFGCCSMK
jgi:hypothetical protein